VPVVGFPAGLQPRAAVGYMFVVAAEAAALSGVAPRIHTEIDAAAARLDDSRQKLLAQAAQIAARLEGTVPVIHGADLTAPVARRWKTQFNENAKLPAFWAELPEADHNELAGWAGAADPQLSAVFLEDSDQHPRERRRIGLTAELASEWAAEVVRIETEGDSRSERLLGGVMLGDLVSLYLAARSGTDPTPVEAIERLKDELGRP
jgi:glucose/mannose-6-phosphate isomerase